VLLEVLHRQPTTAQGLNLDRRRLNVVDPDVKMEAIFESFRLRDMLKVKVRVVRACLRKTDVVSRFAKGIVDLQTEDCTPE
jgi:hypothetical protein